MRKETTILLAAIAMLLFNPVLGQKSEEFTPSGKVYGKVFSNFHSGLLGEDNSSAFEISQAYFGYKYSMTEHFSADIKLDIGNPIETEDGDRSKRYAYFKLAQLQYKIDAITLRFGVIGMKQFKYQEKFWTRKYVKKSFQDYYGYGPSADIGAAVAYDLASNLKIEALVMNGEGYKDVQSDNTYKGGLALTYRPIKNVHLYLYSDFAQKGELASNSAFFVGYKEKEYSFGFEVNQRTNVDYLKDKMRVGISAYASYLLAKKWELFGRYDMIQSNDHESWAKKIDIKTYPKSDGDYIIGGIQFSPTKKVKIAVDGQYYIPDMSTFDPQIFGFVHFQYEL